MSRVTQAKVIGMDLFCGAGGMTLGAINAGIDVKYAIEKCPIAASTYKSNFPNTTVFVSDIGDVKSVPKPPKNRRTLVFGGPPCQGFSTSNQRTRNANNQNNWMFIEFCRIAKMWHPDWIILENVKGIKQTCNGLFLDLIRSELEASNYTVSIITLNAVEFGVPQFRERTFVIASKYGKISIETPKVNQYSTVKDAIYDLPVLSNGAHINELPYRTKRVSKFAAMLRSNNEQVSGNLVTNNARHIIERYEHVPQGGNWEDIPISLMGNYRDVTRCHSGLYRRLRINRPSVVIGNFRKNMLIHPLQNRGLSVREAARIQCLPDTFEFCGTIGYQQQQVGNLVPPPITKYVIQSIVGQ